MTTLAELLVVPPGTPAGAAQAVMNRAATSPGAAQATDILAAEEARCPSVTPGAPEGAAPLPGE